MRNIFKLKRPNVDVMEFNAQHVSTGQIAHYLKKIQEEENFRHLGYKFIRRGHLSRLVIYTLPGSEEIIQYFKDRCPAMVEAECRALKGIAHHWNVWPNGFMEVAFDTILEKS